MRFNGAGNTDAALGATEAIGSPRFSGRRGAVGLREKLSVDTAALADTDGCEMQFFSDRPHASRIQKKVKNGAAPRGRSHEHRYAEGGCIWRPGATVW